MKRNMMRLIIPIILIAALCVLALSAVAPFKGPRIGHECPGEGCAVCLCLAATERFSEGVLLLSVISALFAVPVLMGTAMPREGAESLRPCTPVFLKVKLSD